MTTSFSLPNGPFDQHDATTVRRPRLQFDPPTHPVVPVSGPTWRAGWVISGLAAAFSLAALVVVGTYAFGVLVPSGPTPSAVSIPAPVRDIVVAPPAAAKAPSTAAAPTGVTAPGPLPGAPRVVVVTAPASSFPVQKPADPAPPKPDPPHAPTGIGTPSPTPPAPGTPSCGDLVACTPIPTSPTVPACGDFAACTPPPAARP